MKNLNTLVLSHNEITSLGKSLHIMPDLSKLSVSHNKLDSLGGALKKCYALTELRISHNRLKVSDSYHWGFARVWHGEMAIQRSSNPRLSRGTCSPRYVLRSWRLAHLPPESLVRFAFIFATRCVGCDAEPAR
jgi:Leucine-rich repeat (LRR) protein